MALPDSFNPLEVLLSAMGGAIVTLVAFRTNIAMMKRDITDHRSQLKSSQALMQGLVDALERRFDERADMFEESVQRLNRNHLEMIRLLSDIARKIGVDHRFTDSVIQMLADDRPLLSRDTSARTRRDDHHDDGGG